MKLTKLLALFLALLMLVSTFAACGEITDGGDTQGTTGVGETEPETELTDRLPDGLNYNDTEITIISRYREGWTSGEISVKELISEPVNDAVYERNKAVEQRLGVVINSIEENNNDPSDVVNKVATAVKAGTNEYDIMASVSYKTVRPAYYETTLRTKIAQDPQSAEMFDVIIDNIYIDAGIIYTNALSSFHDSFRQIMGSGKNTVTSRYKSVTRSAERALGKMVEKLDKITDGQ